MPSAPSLASPRATRPPLTMSPSVPQFNPLSRGSWLVRYTAAIAAAVVGLLLRLGLTALVGEGLPTYITFYPAVMVVALLAGLGPGLVATATAAVLADIGSCPRAGSESSGSWMPLAWGSSPAWACS